MNKTLTAVFLILCCCSLFAQPRTLETSIPPGKNYNKANFRIWYHSSTTIIKGILVLMPGSNEDGRAMIADPLWQNFAKNYQFALVGCQFTDLPSKNTVIEKYVNAKDGSGAALLKAFEQLATLSGHPEVAGAPLLLWGFSAGGQFNYEFVCWKPERVIAFVVNKGGIYYSALAPEEARNVPGIFFIGEKDLEGRSDIIKGIFSMNRRFGAVWTFAKELGVTHEIGKTPQLAELFFSEVLALRFSNKYPLKKIHESLGFHGDYKKYKYVPYKQATNESYPSSWLPSSKFADSWLLFVKGSI